MNPPIISDIDHARKHYTETKDCEDHKSDANPVYPLGYRFRFVVHL